MGSISWHLGEAGCVQLHPCTKEEDSGCELGSGGRHSHPLPSGFFLSSFVPLKAGLLFSHHAIHGVTVGQRFSWMRSGLQGVQGCPPQRVTASAEAPAVCRKPRQVQKVSDADGKLPGTAQWMRIGSHKFQHNMIIRQNLYEVPLFSYYSSLS